MNAFRAEIATETHGLSINRDLFSDPNVGYNKLSKILTDAKDKHFKPIIKRFKKYKHKLSPWITSGILHSIKHRDKLYKELKETDPNSEHYDALQINLRTYKAILQKNIRYAKIHYYSNQFEKSKSDMRRTWNTINMVLNKCKNKKEFPKYFISQSKKFDNPADIANLFNDFFTNIGPKLSSNIVSQSNKTVSTYLRQKLYHRLSLIVYSPKM